MFSKKKMSASTESCSTSIDELKKAIQDADTIIVGAGAGLSTSAGLTYSGERFEKYFGDFIKKHHIPDLYSGGFYPFSTPEEYWAWRSRQILINRYEKAPLPVYDKLYQLLKDRDYFVLTTNVDHQFQMAGFDKKRLFYTQGHYGLWQCPLPCHDQTYDNEETVRKMALEQKDMKVPSSLVPHCPVCGRPMAMNLRCDNTFVQDKGTYEAAERYEDFLKKHEGQKVLFLEIGAGNNTPDIIKYPFWQMTAKNPRAQYACISLDPSFPPPQKSAAVLSVFRKMPEKPFGNCLNKSPFLF